MGLGLGLGLGFNAAFKNVVQKLFSKLRARSTYYENNRDSQASVKDTFNYGLLDKATIVLTPTATSDALVHSVKTYIGGELVDNGDFSNGTNSWASPIYNSTLSIVNGQMKIVSSGHALGRAVQQIRTEIGKKYLIKATITNIDSTNGIQFKVSNTYNLDSAYFNSNNNTTTSPVNISATFVATATTTYIGSSQGSGIGQSGLLGNVSITDISSDFAFDRASSATRINSDGLVQDMQSITDPELITNGDFSEIGSELVTNGNFATDSDWNLGAGQWQIINGFAVATNAGNILHTNSPVASSNNKQYLVTFELKDVTSGYIKVGLSNLDSTQYNSDGTYSLYITSSGNNYLYFHPYSFNGKVTNASVKEVGQDWTFNATWSMGDDGANFIGSGSSTTNLIQHGLTLTSGKSYNIKFDVSNATGNASIWIGNSAGSVNYFGTSYVNRPNGSYDLHFTMPSTQSTLSFFANQSGSNFTINNISVKDVTFSDDVDLARINYDTSGQNGHILLEPTRTNEETKSNEFSAWTPSSAANVTPNYIVSPDGTQNASRVQFTGAGFLYNTPQVNSSTLFTISCYAKRNDSGTQSVGFFVNGSGAIDSAWSLTSDWKRFTYTYTSANTSMIGIAGVSGVDISVFGFQIEKTHAYATSYMPTYGSTVTRAAETLTDSGNTTLINSTEGVLFAEIAALANDGNVRYLALSDGSTNNMVSILYYSGNNNIRMMVKSNGGSIADQNTGVTSVLDFHKIAVKYKENDFALWVDGVERKTVTSGATPLVLNTLESGVGGNSRFYGKIKQTALFNEALEDDELELLTGITNFSSFGATASGGGYTVI